MLATNGYVASQRAWKVSAIARTGVGVPDGSVCMLRPGTLAGPGVGSGDRDRNVLTHRSRLSVSDAVSLTLALEPAIVCIDSPSAWSTSGPSRQAERELARIGI